MHPISKKEGFSTFYVPAQSRASHEMPWTMLELHSCLLHGLQPLQSKIKERALYPFFPFICLFGSSSYQRSCDWGNPRSSTLPSMHSQLHTTIFIYFSYLQEFIGCLSGAKATIKAAYSNLIKQYILKP